MTKNKTQKLKQKAARKSIDPKQQWGFKGEVADLLIRLKEYKNKQTGYEVLDNYVAYLMEGLE